MPIPPADHLGAVTRGLHTVERDGQTMHVLTAERTYPALPDEVWDAITDPERIPRWIGGAVTGDLRLGGRYQIEGNAGGEVLECEPPKRLSITWEYDGVSWVDAFLEAAGDGTLLRARAHRTGAAGDVGPVRAGRGRHRLGDDADGPGRAPRRAGRRPRRAAGLAGRAGGPPVHRGVHDAAAATGGSRPASPSAPTPTRRGPPASGAPRRTPPSRSSRPTADGGLRRPRRPGAAPDPGAAGRRRAGRRRGHRGDLGGVRHQPAGGVDAAAGAPRERLRQRPGRRARAGSTRSTPARSRRSTPGWASSGRSGSSGSTLSAPRSRGASGVRR